jgi:hypothetical protein
MVPESSSILNDINKVFIPCRTVLEMEAIISLYLLNSNYESIKEVPENRPSSKALIDILGVKESFYVDIIDFFINCAIPKVKPVVMYAREHHDRYRMGNVAAYAKTRVCVYLALHRLKIKFLIIRNFIDKFKANNYKLDSYYEKETDDEPVNFLIALSKDYYEKNKMNLRLMIPKKRVSERVQKLLNEKDSITSEKLFKLATFKVFIERVNIIKFIMREIKASIFVCKLMFAKMDFQNPFSLTDDINFNLEELMISNDFIPELLPAISKSLQDNNLTQLEDCLNAFDFLMDKVLNGINKAIEITSGGALQIDLYETIYDTGNIFTF